jgi:hypothetical protein
MDFHGFSSVKTKITIQLLYDSRQAAGLTEDDAKTCLLNRNLQLYEPTLSGGDANDENV